MEIYLENVHQPVAFSKRTCRALAQASLARGRVTVKADPAPIALSTVMVPPGRLIISATMYSPMPKPGIARCLERLLTFVV
jgi:hypothetical protein